MRGRVFVLALFFIFLVSPDAPAQEDADEFEGLSCVTKKNALAIHLSVYQARGAEGKEWATYCHNIPRPGKTTLVFDLMYQEMRAMRVAVRVVEVAEGVEPKTLLSVPLNTYPSGVVTIETTFDQPGQYAAIVDFEDLGDERTRADTISLPLRVGRAAGFATFGLLAPWLVVLLVATVGYMAFRYFGRTDGPALMKTAQVACVGLLWTLLLASPAGAHGGVGIEIDPCVQRVGLYLVHFAAYQPQFNPAKEYCGEIPKAGKTILVFDLVDQELRTTPVTIRIVDTANAGAPRTLLEVPPKTYPNGVVNAEADLTPPGEYLAVITLQEPQQTISFPLRVGMWPTTLILIACLLLGGATLYYIIGRNKGWPLLPGRTAPPPRLHVVKKSV